MGLLATEPSLYIPGCESMTGIARLNDILNKEIVLGINLIQFNLFKWLLIILPMSLQGLCMVVVNFMVSMETIW